MSHVNSNTDLEEVILGTIISNPVSIIGVKELLKDSLFYGDGNRLTFKAIETILNEGRSLDLFSLIVELTKSKNIDFVGGKPFLVGLLVKTTSPAILSQHVAVINQLYILRQLESIGQIITNESLKPNTDCFELIEFANKKLNDLTKFVINKTKTLGSIYKEVVDEIRIVIESGKRPGIESGIKKLDNHTGGWQNGSLIILAARPGMGKTATALQFAKHPVFINKKPVAVFSLEMSATQLTGRLISSESLISSSEINQKNITHAKLLKITDSCVKFPEYPLYIDDTPGLKIGDLKAKALKLKHEFGIELLIIDYLQLMHGNQNGNREQEISYITRELKTLAKELDIPIIALSQLSRLVETSQDKRPQLSHLRESGAIEQDADIVMFLWRPEYYGLYNEGYEYNKEKIDVRNLMIIDIAKGREISTGEIISKFYGEFMIISDYNSQMEANNEFISQF
jgi:replicative DNA helicase